MNRTATIQARIDPQVKTKAKIVFGTLGISMSEAISLFLNQVVLRKEIPFEIKIPNKLTAETLRKVDQNEDVHEVAGIKELFKELDS